MKTKKQRKITIAQIRAVEKKLETLQHKQANITKQITPLKITIRKYIQQNMEACEAWLGILGWAVDKIKRGYFGDAHLRNLRDITRALLEFEKGKE